MSARTRTGPAVAGERAQRVGDLPDLPDLAVGHDSFERLAEPLLCHVLLMRAAGAAVTGRVAEIDLVRTALAGPRRTGVAVCSRGGRAARTTPRGGWSTHGGVPRPGSPRGTAG